MVFVAMVLFPEAQSKAQKELDQVLGINRLPTIELNYVRRLIKEVLRWGPVTPLGKFDSYKLLIQP